MNEAESKSVQSLKLKAERLMCKIVGIWCLFLLALPVPVHAQRPDTAGYANGMVVSAHPEASRVGVEILKKGGNAVDAAVAIQFALAVVYPNAGNIGGGGFMVLRQKNGEVAALDFRERAPFRAHRDMYLDAQKKVIDGLSISGHLAAGVPGTVEGMEEAWETYGSMPWEALLEPAVKLAGEGFALTDRQARQLNGAQESFLQYNTSTYRTGSRYFIKAAWSAGDTLRQHDLAETLKRIQDKGSKGFYKGRTARLLVKEMRAGGGIIRRKDLRKYRAAWREPVTGTYKDYKVISMAPPSSGGIALMQLLKMVAPYPLSAWEHNETDYVHLLAEAERRVYADRAAYLGDPDFYEVPEKQLLGGSYLAGRMASFDPEKATPSSSVEAGEVPGYAAKPESMETTHFSIVDAAGNAVSQTTTLNGNFGSKVFVNGAGFLLNNEMDDFSIKPGVPNMFGLIGGEANAIGPGKRMLSSMTPTILEKDGKLFMVVGTPGGSTIITTVFQTILNVVEAGMGMQEAVNAKRFHNQWMPDEIRMEKEAIPAPAVRELESRGHRIRSVNAIGRCDAILVKDGKLYGGADPRGDDTSTGY